jgi:acylglycerol lipase
MAISAEPRLALTLTLSGAPGPVAALAHPAAPAWIAAPSGYRIPVHRFGVGGARRPVVMLHGLQSHAGWFVQSARRIAALGLPVHAFDRCGSGASEGETEIGSRLEGLLAEVDAVADQALAGTGHRSVHLLGHCFGAIVALLYAALHRPARVASLVLATPALYTQTDLPPRDKLRVLWSVLTRRPARIPVPLSPEQFSELEPFVAFVRDDPLALRTAPARLLYEVRRARGLLARAAGALQAPLLVALAGDDRICDNRRNRRLFERVTSPMEIGEYAGARHILEFSGQREAFLNDLAAWFQRREPG